METQIRADEISRVLKEQINQYNKKIEVSETGSAAKDDAASVEADDDANDASDRPSGRPKLIRIK
jgi:hypothetical protein